MSVMHKLKSHLDYAINMAEEQVEHCRRYDGAGVEEAQELVDEMIEFYPKLSDYVLLHKSHLEVHQLYDQASASYLTNGMLHVMCSDRIHHTELLQYRFREEVLESKVPKIFDKMVKYLEAPKPEQTQPAQS